MSHEFPDEAALAAGVLDDTDAVLLRQLAQLYDTADPVPDGLVERLQFGASLDALHAEIAAMERMDDLVGARSEQAPNVQSITFTTPRLTTMVSISPAGAERVRVDGWVVPGGGVVVELRLAVGSREARADADGRFVFEDVPDGQGQFVLRIPGDPVPVITPALQLHALAS